MLTENEVVQANILQAKIWREKQSWAEIDFKKFSLASLGDSPIFQISVAPPKHPVIKTPCDTTAHFQLHYRL